MQLEDQMEREREKIEANTQLRNTAQEEHAARRDRAFASAKAAGISYPTPKMWAKARG